MAMIYGVDSTTPANTRLTNGYHLYDWVMRLSSVPAFWGRNVSGETHITAEEIEFLRERNCKIALLFNDLTEADVSVTCGTNDAVRLLEAVRALGVPAHKGIGLFAVIEPNWSVSHNWMLSFALEIFKNGYVAGFIGNTDSSKNHVYNRQCSHYAQAAEQGGCWSHLWKEGNYSTVYWSTEPKPRGEPDEWNPYCPSALRQDQMSIWQNGTVTLGDVTANTNYTRDEAILRYMWQ